jgi:hypothetical protein
VTKVDKCSCRYNEDIREHAVVRPMHREDIIIEEIELESQSCAQNACRHEAAAMKGVILVASRFRLQQFLDMLWGTYVSIYCRKFGVFWWLDHRERVYELVALLLDRTGRQRKIEFIWTLWNENEEENAWDLVCGGRGCLGLLL